MAPVLGYWNVRGLAQPIRNLLHHVGADFEDKIYHFGPAPDFDRKQWLDEKPNLSLKFPNLPYYIDGETKLTQSMSILRYLGRKHGLDASNDEERLELDLLEQQAQDLRWGIIMTLFSPNYDEGRKRYLDNLASVLKPWSDHLENKQWALGDRLTYVDFLLYEGLDWIREFAKGSLDSYPVLGEYCKKFEKLPNIEKFFSSGKYNTYPITGPMAKWGYEKSE